MLQFPQSSPILFVAVGPGVRKVLRISEACKIAKEKRITLALYVSGKLAGHATSSGTWAPVPRSLADY